MTRIRTALVVVPARDEAERIGRCLDAVDAACAVARDAGIAVRVAVVADACRDDTAAIARARGALVVEIDAARVGAARAAGVDALAAGLEPASTWIACTDADSVVPPSWLAHHARLADAGTDAVLGLVHLRPDDASAPPLAVWHASAEAGERIHGANLGVRLSAYRAAGGFAALAAHEDVALVAALRAAGAAVVATLGASVRTSGRRVGRAPGGFAGRLSAIAPVGDAALDRLPVD